MFHCAFLFPKILLIALNHFYVYCGRVTFLWFPNRFLKCYLIGTKVKLVYTQRCHNQCGFNILFFIRQLLGRENVSLLRQLQLSMFVLLGLSLKTFWLEISESVGLCIRDAAAANFDIVLANYEFSISALDRMVDWTILFVLYSFIIFY